MEDQLIELMDDVKKALGDNGPIENVYEQEDNDSEDPTAMTKRLETEAMTYLAEGVRTAVCEEIYVEDARFLGSGRGITYGYDNY